MPSVSKVLGFVGNIFSKLKELIFLFTGILLGRKQAKLEIENSILRDEKAKTITLYETLKKLDDKKFKRHADYIRSLSGDGSKDVSDIEKKD